MCLKPKIPKVEPMAPPPVVKDAPDKPDPAPDARPLRDEEAKETKITYGSKPSDALLSKKQGGGSIINLNRSSLNSAGANQQGLGGGTTA